MRNFALILLLAGCDLVSVDITNGTNPPTTTTTTTTTTTKQTVIDSFVHDPGEIDVLFVIDDSASMVNDLQELVSGVPTLLDVLDDTELDYHVGVVTTDMVAFDKSGQLQTGGATARWVDPTTKAPEADLVRRLPGYGGAAVEEALEAAETALVDLAATNNAGFRRVDAQLSVIVVADEDDESGGAPQDYTASFLGLGSSTGDVTFSVMSFLGAATRLVAVSDAIGGAQAEINKPDYTAFFDDIAALWWGSVPYALSGNPDISTLEVWVDHGKGFVEVGSAYITYDVSENTVRLEAGAPVSAGADLEIRYLSVP